MNLPNRLTIARLFLTAGFVASMTLAWRWKSPDDADWTPLLSWSWGYTAGLVLFVAAAITDYFDGEIARRRNLVTDFGKLMDPAGGQGADGGGVHLPDPASTRFRRGRRSSSSAASF